MKTCQRGIDSILVREGLSGIRTSFRHKLKNACEKLTQKQRKFIVWALLIVFAVLVWLSIMDIFRDRAKLSEPKHIVPLRTLENPKDTDSHKIINNEREQQ